TTRGRVIAPTPIASVTLFEADASPERPKPSTMSTQPSGRTRCAGVVSGDALAGASRVQKHATYCVRSAGGACSAYPSAMCSTMFHFSKTERDPRPRLTGQQCSRGARATASADNQRGSHAHVHRDYEEAHPCAHGRRDRTLSPAV